MSSILKRRATLVIAVFALKVSAFAQMPSRPVPTAPPPPVEDFTWWYIALGVLVVGLGAALWWWYQTKMVPKFRKDSNANAKGPADDSVDAEAELAWLHKFKKRKNQEGYPDQLPKASSVLGKGTSKDSAEYKEAKRRVESARFESLPLMRFSGLKDPAPFKPLESSNDAALICAIEQTHCEDEEDPEIRELAIRILARFRNSNSIDALSQTALYDVASALRSKAVGVLAEMDHESVFETILMCCADPTREVRAAAARALFQVNFDRADAWARIANSSDEYRMVQAARAAIESDLVERSIERLIHEDEKHAYEAFALIALLIRAGETMEIFQILESHADKWVKMGLIRVFKIIPDERAIKHLTYYMERNTLPEDIGKAVNECIRMKDMVPA